MKHESLFPKRIKQGYPSAPRGKVGSRRLG